MLLIVWGSVMKSSSLQAKKNLASVHFLDHYCEHLKNLKDRVSNRIK